MADVLATPSARLTMIVGATAVFLGLAVLGWGGVSAFFSHPALTALALVTFVISAAPDLSRGKLRTGGREDPGHRWGIRPVSVDRPAFGHFPPLDHRPQLRALLGPAGW